LHRSNGVNSLKLLCWRWVATLLLYKIGLMTIKDN